MPVTCFVKGGLGNQLFQIYATASYAFSQKQSVMFPYQTEMHGGCTPRAAYWDTFLSRLRNNTTHNIQELASWPVIQCPQHHFKEIPAIPDGVRNIRLDGYFQSHKYFAGKDGERWLTRMLDIHNKIQNLQYVYNLQGAYNVSMHFRLGDYKRLQNFHTVLEDDYYVAALEKILLVRAVNSPVRVYYLCEEEDKADVMKRVADMQRQFEGRAEFVHIPEDLVADWEQMLFMAACDANIIANSSFSWWGAYWNHSPNKVVCYPHRWFGPALSGHDIRDMFPDDWILV